LSPQSKIAVLVAILLADLLFFMFFSVNYPEILRTFLRQLPWEDNVEKAVLVISGFGIAVLSSAAIVHTIVKNLQSRGK